MPFKPKRQSAIGPQGQAKVHFTKDKTKAQVHFHPNLEEDYADKKFVVSEFPDWIKESNISNGKEWMVRLSGESKNRKIISMYPYRAIGLKGRVQGIASQKDKPPVPKENDGKFGKYYTFTVLIEVTSDGAKGAIVPYSLPYNFGSDEDNLVCYNSWGKNSKRLDAFLTAAGAWDHVPDPFPYRDNILPILQKAMLHAGRELVFQIKDGWVVAESIDTLSSDSWDDEDDFGNEEDFAPEVEEDAPADDESFEDDSEEDDFEDASDEDFEWD